MLIVDIPGKTTSNKKLRVGIIGSCRIRDIFTQSYDLSDQEIANTKQPLTETCWYKFSAFTHTPKQALQYYRFITGELDIPESLHPLILSRSLTPEISSRIKTLTKEIIDSIDIFAVEISTTHEFTVDHYHCNVSYTEKSLIRSGGKPLLKWWRSLTANSPDHQAIVQETLDILPSKDVPNTDGIRTIIKNARRTDSSMSELRDSISELASTVNKPLMLIPIPNVPENFDPNRFELANKLRDIAIADDYHFMDPTVAVSDAGSNVAYAGNGVDTRHYSPGFHYTLIEHMTTFLESATTRYDVDNTFTQSEILKAA